MNLEVDIPEDYVGPLTGMDFAKSQLQILSQMFTMWRVKSNCVHPVTTVCHKTLALLLRNYDSAKANYLVCSLNNGFRIGFQGDRHFRASPNLKSASEFPEIVEKKLAKEIS
jgi:hypothetical protein